MTSTYIIVGAGQAGGQAIATLRAEGFDGRIVLVGEEPYIPYQRPPLSKKFLAGEIGLDRLYIKPPGFYPHNNVTLILNARAIHLDREEKNITTEDGQVLSYDKLLIATGSEVRRLDVPGADLPGVHYLRTIEDVQAIQRVTQPGGKVVIVGAGYIGLEVAAIAVKRNRDTTVLEMAPQVMGRVVGPEVAAFFENVHRAEGVKIHTGVTVTGFEGGRKIQRVLTADGTSYEADLAVIGVGVRPSTGLAEAAGLDVDEGIVVDEFGRTSDPSIFAAGDCTNHPNAIYGRRVRLESVHNAIEQAKSAAMAMVGKLKVYSQVPWFWSDQYDLKLQIAGLSEGYDDVVIRGDPAKRSFAAFYLKKGVLIAVDAVNSPLEYMASKGLIAEGAETPPERLSDDKVSIKELV